MSEPLYDQPTDDGAHRPVYSLDEAAGADVAGGWNPAPVGSRRWYREQEPASPLSPGVEAFREVIVPESAAMLEAQELGRAPESPRIAGLPAPTEAPAWPASSFPSAPAQTPSAAVAPQGRVSGGAAVPAPPLGAAASQMNLTDHARHEADRDLIEALSQVVVQGASDLHVTVDAAPTIRVDGHLQPAIDPAPWGRVKVQSALSSLLNAERQDVFDAELELDFAYQLSPESRFRVNFYQQRGVLGAVFRLIPTEIKTLDQLGMDPVIGKFAGLPRGLVLVTGPTGSGKSTTLAALIDLANTTRADHIVTVEDPIEFMHNHKKALVNQREVGSDTHSFANALKHVLRQDPDIILIGELRDLETISVALTAAETGHLVFATLHTQDAAQTIDRVIDVFPPHQQDQVRTQLASTLQGVVCQTLVPRASGKGRVVATEIMMMTPAVGNLIREGKTYQISSSMQAGRDLGMHTMDQDLADLVNSGKVTLKAALEKVHDTEGFHRLVTRTDTGAGQGMAAGGIDFGDAFSKMEH